MTGMEPRQPHQLREVSRVPLGRHQVVLVVSKFATRRALNGVEIRAQVVPRFAIKATTELFGITPWHEQVSFDDFVTKSQANQLRKTGGTSSPPRMRGNLNPTGGCTHGGVRMGPQRCRAPEARCWRAAPPSEAGARLNDAGRPAE